SCRPGCDGGCRPGGESEIAWIRISEYARVAGREGRGALADGQHHDDVSVGVPAVSGGIDEVLLQLRVLDQDVVAAAGHPLYVHVSAASGDEGRLPVGKTRRCRIASAVV